MIVQHQNNVVADKAIVNNITGVGVPSQNQGDTPCQQSVEQKPEPINIVHAGNQPWPMGDAGCMEEKALGLGHKQGKSD